MGFSYPENGGVKLSIKGEITMRDLYNNHIAKNFIIQAFATAIAANQIGRALSLASTMTDSIKAVAREVWETERSRSTSLIRISAPF
jgi:hypothetical protein